MDQVQKHDAIQALQLVSKLISTNEGTMELFEGGKCCSPSACMFLKPEQHAGIEKMIEEGISLLWEGGN